MAEPLVDVDLDAFAPSPKKVKLGGKVWKLPGDLPLTLFFKLQTYDKRVEDGGSEVELLAEMRDELLTLFQVHQPNLKELPEIGLTTLVAALPAVYSGGAVGEAPPNRATRRQKTKTPSARTPARRARATSR